MQQMFAGASPGVQALPKTLQIQSGQTRPKLSETEMCPLPTVLDIRERPEGDPVWVDGFPRAGQLPAGCRYPLRSGLMEAVWSQAKKNTPPGIGEEKPVFCSCVTRSLLHLSPEPSCEGGFIKPTLSIQGTRESKRRGDLFKVTRPAGGRAKFQSQVCLMPVPSSASRSLLGF